MQTKYTLYSSIVICLILLFSSCSTINRSTRFKKVTREYSLNYCGDVIKAPVTELNNEIWIVFSDREANTTYQNPGGKVKLKEAGFLEPFLVIKEKGEYLCLVKYDPEIIDPSLLVNKIKNRSKVQYYGWVHKSKLILSRQSVTDIGTGFKDKAISIISDTTAVFQSKTFIKSDSIVIYRDEALTKEQGKLPFYEMLYILKTSKDNKKALISRKPLLSPDGVQSEVLGWVHASFVKNIGQRLHVDASTIPSSYYTFFSSKSAYNDTLYVDKGYFDESFSFSNRKNTGIKHAPVLFYKNTSNDGVSFRTGLPMNVADPSSYYVLNVDGNKVGYHKYREWEKSLRKLNLIFVFEGKKAVMESYPKIVNVIQNLQPKFEDENDIFSYKFGAVFAYQGNSVQAQTKTIGFTDSFSDMMEQLDVETENMVRQRPLPLKDTWSGLRKAVDMLKNSASKDETNILVVLGESGNSERIDSVLVNRIAETNCRVLGFQLHGEENNTGNNFVLQISDLITYYSDKQSVKKREKIVFPDQVKPYNRFRESSKNVYSLDYPNNSMSQGWVLFPEKSVDLPLNSLALGIDTLIFEVKSDNDMLVNSLEKAFNSTAKYRMEYSPLWLRYNRTDKSELPVKHPNIDADFPMWYMPTQPLLFTNADKDDLRYNLLLSERELRDLMTFLRDISANEVDYKYKGKKEKPKKICNCPDDELIEDEIYFNQDMPALEYMNTNKIRAALQKIYLEGLSYCRLCKHSTKDMKRMSIAEAHRIITGSPTQNLTLRQCSVDDIKKKKVLTDRELDELITYFKAKKETLERLLTTKQIQKFDSNGETYYWINQSLLP